MAGLSNLLPPDPNASLPDPRDIPLSNPLAGFDPSQGQDAGQLPGLPQSFPNLGFSPPTGTFDDQSQWQPRTDVPFDFSQTAQQANTAAGKLGEAQSAALKAGMSSLKPLGLPVGAAVGGIIEPWMTQGMPTAYASPFPSQFFSQRTEYFHQTPGEFGNDFAMPVGTPIRAPWDGTIRWEQSGKANWGNRIFVTGGHGWTFAVGHLTRFAVGNGTAVKAGQIIGFSGGATSDPNSGNTTGPHIEPQLLNPRGQYVDPSPWLQRIFGQGPAPGATGYNLTQPNAAGQAPAKPNAPDVIYGPGSANYRSQYENLIPHNLQASGHAGAAGPGMNFAAATLHPQPPPAQGMNALLPQASAPVKLSAAQEQDIAMLPPSLQGQARATMLAQAQQAAKTGPGPQPNLLDLPGWLANTVTSPVNAGLPGGAAADINPLSLLRKGATGILGQAGQDQEAALRALVPGWENMSPDEKNVWFGQFGIGPGVGTAFQGGELASAARGAQLAAGATLGREAEPMLPGLGETLAQKLGLAGKPPEVVPPPAQITASGAQMTLDPAEALKQAQGVPGGMVPAQPVGASLAGQAGGVTPEMMAKMAGVDPEGLAQLGKTLEAGLWKGFLNQGHSLVQELAQTAPDQVAQVAEKRIQSIQEQIATWQKQIDQEAAPGGQLALGTAEKTPNQDLLDKIAHADLTLGVYTSALKRMVGGYDHELAPVFRSIANTVRNPYVLRPGTVDLPTDANLAVHYNGKMRGALDALGQNAATWMEKNFPDDRLREQVWQAMENPDEALAAGLDPRVIQLAKATRLLLDNLGIYLADERGMFDALRKDYFPRIITGFRDPVTGKVVKGRDLRELIATSHASPLNTDSPRFHTRSIQDGLGELESRGWIVQKDPAQVLPMYLRSVGRAVGNDNILNFIKTGIIARDGKPAYVEGLLDKGGPEGYKHLFVEGDHPASPKLSGWIHPDIVRQLNYQLKSESASLFGSEGAYRAAQFGGEIFREGVMVNPLFHGLNQFAHQLMHTWLPPRLWVQGHFALQDPEFMREVATYTAYRPHRVATDFNQAMDNIAAGVPRWRFGQDWKGIPSPLQYAVDKSHTLLFDFMIGNAQAMIYKESRDKFMALGMDAEQARLAAGAKADRVVGMQDPMTKSQWERQMAPLIFFAPNWTKTHVLQPFEAAPGIGKFVLMKERPYLTSEAAGMLNDEITWSTLRGILTAQFYNQVMNIWSSGHPTWQNEPGRTQDWNITQFVRDHLGYRGTQQLYIEGIPNRFNNWYLNGLKAIDRRGGFTPGGVALGVSDFTIGKMMPPLSLVLQMVTDENSPTANARAIKALEGLFPLQRQLQAMTGDQVIGPHSIEKLAGAIRDIKEGNLERSPDAQRLLLAIAAFGTGENPPKHGPAIQTKQGAPTSADVVQNWMVGMELQRQGIAPATANEQQKAAARDAVESQADPEGYYEAMNKHNEDTQAKALEQVGKEVGVDLSLAKQADYRAQGLNPMDLLDAMHKAEIFNQHPELELWHQVPSRDPNENVRAVQSDNAAYHVLVAQLQDTAKLQQQQDDYAAAQGIISPQTWRDRRIRRLDSLYNKDTGGVTALLKAHPNAIIDRASYDKYLAANGKPPRQVTRFDAAYEEYKAVNLDDPKYQLPDGTPDVLAWKTARDAILADLPKDQQDYIRNRESANWTNAGPVNEFLYHQVTNEYLNFEQQHADAVRLYHEMYQKTDTPLARKFFEAQHPELFTYIIQRALWFREHPLAAAFFEHGYGLQKTLLTSGVDPFASPAEQIASLLRNPRPTEPLDLSGISQSAAGTGQPAQQSAPAQPGSFAQTLYQNPP